MSVFGVTGPKVKISTRYREIITAVACMPGLSALRYSHSLWNVSAKKEGGVYQFRMFSKNKLVTRATSLERSHAKER